jgi:hypothetical protein
VTRCNGGQAIDWAEVVSPAQEPIYLSVIRGAEAQGVRFAVGGSLAVAAYAGRNKKSKDLDLYVLPEDRDRMVEILTAIGLRDYYDELPYDRRWIYRATNGETIVDVIWSMANQRTNVDEDWLTRGMAVTWYGHELRMIPIEEMIWSKLYVLQRDRCDWPDILNLIDATGSRIDWTRLVARVGDDAPLVSALLSVYHWLNPPDARSTPHPASISAIGSLEQSDPELARRRADLLDSRPWLLSLQEEGGNHQC